jgi:hypothetical protein
MSTFFQNGPAEDQSYINIRDLEHARPYRNYVESLWEAFEPLADRHFLSDAKAHFLERFWEMYLAKALNLAGWSPQTPGNKGPDFLVSCSEKKIFLEATAPGIGEGDDSVPEMKLRAVQAVPEKEILLHLRSAISSKLDSWKKWCSQGLVDSGDTFVIAINGRRIRAGLGDSEPPFIVRAVFPIGPLSAVWDKSKYEIVETYYDYRDTLNKKSGAKVETDIFLSSEFRDVSAVVYSFVDAANHPQIEGQDFRLVHNPSAKNPLPRGFFKLGREYWLKGNEVVSQNWNER